jgi:DNA-binding GntR family transcriptional regulator
MGIENNYRTIREIVYDTLKERILKGQYSPGQRLITNDLANEFNVSRMPIREALQQLEAATGLVSMIPHKGATVVATSEEDLVEVFQIRVALESLAARLACPNLDESQIDQLESLNHRISDLKHTDDEERFQELNLEFHSRLWRAANAPRLETILRALYDASRNYRYISLKLPGRFEEVVQEHKDIIAALRSGKECDVEAIVKNHYQQTLDWLMRSRKK